MDKHLENMQDEDEILPSERECLIFQFNVVIRDVSAFMVDGEYSWSNDPMLPSTLSKHYKNGILPVIDKCGIVLKLQQVCVFSVSCYFLGGEVGKEDH